MRQVEATRQSESGAGSDSLMQTCGLAPAGALYAMISKVQQ